jgi:hypothetical protein
MRFIKLLLTLLVAIGICVASADAQFAKGKSFLGPHIGLSGVGSTITFGGDYEYGVTKEIGIGALVDYWKYDFDFFLTSSGFSYSYLVIGATGSYHFDIKEPKWDVFGGLALGYYIVSVTTPVGTFTGFDSSRLFVGLQGGARYFISPNLALQGRLGFGAYILAVGVDFKF